MKVIFLIPSFKGGGAEKQCVYLLNELQKRTDFDIHLVYFTEGVNFELLTIDNLTLHKIKYRSFYNPINIWRLYLIFKKVEPNLWISWLHAADVYSFFLKLVFRNTKWIMTERDSDYPNDWRFQLRKFTSKFSDLIIANSKAGFKYWANLGVEEQKIAIAKNILYKENCSRRIDKSTVLFAGRFEDQKNVLNIVRSFLETSKTYRELDFVLIGEGKHYDMVASIISKEDSLGKVKLLPYQKEIKSFYEKAKVFVNVSFHEGTPNTVIENIGFGNLVVVSGIKEHRDLLGPDYPYYVSDLHDFNHISEVISNALCEENPRKCLEFAKFQLNQMEPEKVVGFYIAQFNN